MTEAVRFYWGTGEAALPLDAIAEVDRDPLRVRRGVVQAHAPEVIKQLQEGRFVAAAWSSGEDLCVVLCHPSLAQGPDDAILASASSVPNVLLKRGRADEAPVVAGLLLKGSGGESATPEEVATARRDLAAWIRSRGQPELTAVTGTVSAFPFGARSDALEVINAWRKVLVRGEKDPIDRFLREAQRRFEELGWSRGTLGTKYG